MTQAVSRSRNFARRLIAQETRGRKSSGTPAVFPVFDKLRPKLAVLMGSGGYRALVSRALARARGKAPSLGALRLDADGSLELDPQVDPREIAEGQVELLAELLELLVAFIGEDLTLRLTREAWPAL